MKILLVEDDSLKRSFVENFLERRGNIGIESFQSIKPAISYTLKHSQDIDGIILDLGLTSYDYTDDYDFRKGLKLVEELTKNGIKIPILIYSGDYINLSELRQKHPNVKLHMDEFDFLTCLDNSLIVYKKKKWLVCFFFLFTCNLHNFSV